MQDWWRQCYSTTRSRETQSAAVIKTALKRQSVSSVGQEESPIKSLLSDSIWVFQDNGRLISNTELFYCSELSDWVPVSHKCGCLPPKWESCWLTASGAGGQAPLGGHSSWVLLRHMPLCSSTTCRLKPILAPLSSFLAAWTVRPFLLLSFKRDCLGSSFGKGMTAQNFLRKVKMSSSWANQTAGNNFQSVCKW